MRPALLNPLFAPAASLPGVGPKTGPLLDRLVGIDDQPARVVDLLFHLPYATIDRRARPKIAEARWNTIVTVAVTVAEHLPPKAHGRGPYRIRVEDETGEILLVFFHGNNDWLRRALPPGSRRWVSGKLENYDGYLQIVHPDRILDPDDIDKLPAIEPVYALTEGLGPHLLSRALAAALGRVPALPEWQDGALLRDEGLPTFARALRALHRPETPEAIAPSGPAFRRLAMDELLASQLALGLARARLQRGAGRASAGDGRLRAKILAGLPFALTGAQVTALAEIDADLGAPRRMLRLLQGDVGSGKTIVAFLAMARAVEAGRQAALMAPTEILARQHHARLAPLAAAAGIGCDLVTGRDRAGERRDKLARLESGSAGIVIGTHALIEAEVRFHDLALAVIDEQHRFGVQQRLALSAKGEAVDLLVMTATPIPRTLVLTWFGDMDVSTLREKPPGRRPVETRALPLERVDEVLDGLRRAIARGARVYWICPLITENPELGLGAAEERFKSLKGAFGTRVGFLHGQMKGAARDAAMHAFHEGDIDILVATTVVEVGVDVPEATIMVIEHAEVFGLAQLHQLRGRIGRGGERSTCLLLYKGPLGAVAEARIRMLRESDDGFAIAEEDVRLRGEGEVLGTRQSGMPGFRLARLDVHGPLLPLVRADALAIARDDPRLGGARGEALRLLLYLFDRDSAVGLIEAG